MVHVLRSRDRSRGNEHLGRETSIDCGQDLHGHDQDVDRAITDGRDDGFVKLHVRNGTDEILGATIVASRASEMINEVAHTYPAQSDAIRSAAVAYVNGQRSRLGNATVSGD